MSKRLLYGILVVLLAISVALVAWQGSFSLQQFGPTNASQTYIYWAISSLIFILMVTLGFIVARTGVKLYVERQANREGSRIRTKLVLGALTLSIVPIFCLLLFSYEILNFNMKGWFMRPAEQQDKIFAEVGDLLDREIQTKLRAQAALLAGMPETRHLLEDSERTPGFLERFAKDRGLASAAIARADDSPPIDRWEDSRSAKQPGEPIRMTAPVESGGKRIGAVTLSERLPIDLEQHRIAIARIHDELEVFWEGRKVIRRNYLMLMALITLFVLFVTTWVALFLARQISIPITALLEAARAVSEGDLQHRVQVRAADEIGTLVRAFNGMTERLELSNQELDRRSRFTEAILESIPSGVISITSDGSVKRTNAALAKILPEVQPETISRLEDLFSREDTAEIKYLMKRARRTGVASRQIELRTPQRNLQLSVTVAALEERLTSGFVIVIEDTTELLRAQKSAAWHEVARRVAHEIKNPLTPIALSAERISRQLERLDLPPAASRIAHECTATITKCVESVKTLVDEFSQFARFPAAQLVRGDLNEVVSEALAVFQGRIEGITLVTGFAPGLPAVNIDREQFGRVVVNLVDNAAEAMQDSLVKNLFVGTQMGPDETVELVVADSGPGIGPDDKAKLFLPYFSTKNRGTGLGLAIVSHIVGEHHGHIRVEDNQPSGARFTIEIPMAGESEGDEGPSTRPEATARA